MIAACVFEFVVLLYVLLRCCVYFVCDLLAHVVFPVMPPCVAFCVDVVLCVVVLVYLLCYYNCLLCLRVRCFGVCVA